MKFEYYFNLFIEHLKLINQSKRTILHRRIFLKDFFRFLEKQGVTEISDIRHSHIAEYQRYRSEIKNHYGRIDTLEAQNRYIASVKKFMLFLKREGYIVVDPASDVSYIKLPKRLPASALTHDEFKRMVAKADTGTALGYRDRTILEVFYSSALRRDELRDLRFSSIDFENGFARVIGKGNKERMVPIGKIACQYLESYIKGIRPGIFRANKTDYLFISKRGNRISNSAMKDLIDKYSKAAKIKKHVTPHTLRRSAATGMIRNKANIMLVRDLLGHDSVEAIKHYIDLTIVDLKEAHRKTHPRERS